MKSSSHILILQNNTNPIYLFRSYLQITMFNSRFQKALISIDVKSVITVTGVAL